MSGRRNPKWTDPEKKREYVKHQLKERGEKLVGDRAAWLDERGAVGEIRRERQLWWQDRFERRFERPPVE